ncbi:Fc.00g041040.m01.CDS01 [Cosmosporella sp. VM-42]
MSTPRASPRPPRTPKPDSVRATPTKAKPNTSKEEAQAIEDHVSNLSAEWQRWPEFTVMLDNLPPDVSTSDIWDWFSHEGEISYMDIFDHRGTAMGTASAKIRFEPPPHRAFWVHGSVSVVHPDLRRFPNGLIVAVQPARFTPNTWIKSPVCPDRAHPVKMTLRPLSIEFGSLLSPTKMKVLRTLAEAPGDGSFRIDVNLKYQQLRVFFPMEIETDTSRYIRQHYIHIDFSRMKNLIQSTGVDDTTVLVLPLQFPPQYYWKRDDVKATFSDAAKSWNQNEAWYRATDIVESPGCQMKHPIALHTNFQDPGYIDLGRWTTFRFILEGKSEEVKALNQQVMNALEDFNIPTKICDKFEVIHGQQAEMWEHLDHPPTVNEGGALSLLNFSSAPLTRLEFKVRYQLEVCISRGILNEHTISTEWLQTLASVEPLKARLRLEFLADQNEPLEDPMRLFKDPDLEGYFPNQRPPHYCALIRKAVITPTTIRFNTPTVETSNRVIRRYNNIQDRFLRVQFAEELEKGRITLNKDQSDEIWVRVLRTLFQGIRIGDRVYEFLAFGSSQLRQCGAYFFCPTDHVSCDDIRKWMGQFDHIKIIAKYAARLGQCFSTTREIRGISVPAIRLIADIDRNGYCFTDGIGKISRFVSKMVIEEMRLDVFDAPSAFQFRMGGCKGVLAMWPDAEGMEVHIRESQEKFKADFNGLEIIRCAKFATATLNRQTITILESLHVPIQAFVDLLDEQLKSYEQAMRHNHIAVDLLTKFVDENQTTLIIAEMLKAGFKQDSIQEPFVVNVLELWRSWSLKLLKEKARINVEESAFVLGCVDETGTLRGHSRATEGCQGHDVNKLPQIFLQIADSKAHNSTYIIQGVCIVGRNPSLHPGDIRVVQAVDNKKLHHLKDVVVFPSKGDRPVPNMLSGGDLDGDDFFVIWDKSLIPQIWNYPPMDYTGSKPNHLDRDVNVDDLRNFFVKYMKNDVLPLIAYAHLAFADDIGPMSTKCLELAELHSKAVDYPKTGDPATMRRDQQPRKWPHFMEKRNSYNSRKALGIIYDKVVNRAVQFNPIWDSPFDQRITKRFKLDNKMLKAARKIKTQYDTAIRRILSQHDLKTEFELWTAFAMSKPAIGSDYKRQEDLGREYDALKHRFRDMCYEAAGGKHTEQVDRFVAAMYTITEEETKIALFEHHRGPVNEAGHIHQPRRLEARSMPLISFPWIFHWVLIRIAMGREYDPKDTMLAAARRTIAPVHQKGEVSESTEATKEVTPTNLGDDVHTHLPDGTVFHMGQPLALFHSEEDGIVESSPNPDEGKALTGSPSDRQGDAVGSGSGLVEGVEGGEEIDGGGEVDTDAGAVETCEIDVQEESAVDRLTRLLDDEDGDWDED